MTLANPHPPGTGEHAEWHRRHATPPPTNDAPPEAGQQPRAQKKQSDAIRIVEPSVAAVKPDVQIAQAFLELLAPGEPVTFQTFDDRGERKEFARILHGYLDERASELLRLNAQGAGVYWTVNRTDLRGRKSHNVIAVRALFVDLDGAPIEPVRAASCAPSLIVESSPGRWHAYWRVEGIALEQFEALQKALAAKFGGDTIVCDLPRVMRLPGFVHRKAKPFLSRTVMP